MSILELPNELLEEIFRFGAAAITFGLPILCYVFTFGCNDITGCPAPSLLHPKSLSLEQLKSEVAWPENGLLGLASWKATGGVLGYYLFNLLLYVILPGTEVEGTKLSSGGRLKYRFNCTSTHRSLRPLVFSLWWSR